MHLSAVQRETVRERHCVLVRGVTCADTQYLESKHQITVTKDHLITRHDCQMIWKKLTHDEHHLSETLKVGSVHNRVSEYKSQNCV